MAQKQYLLKNLYGDQTKQELKWTPITYYAWKEGTNAWQKVVNCPILQEGLRFSIIASKKRGMGKC